MDVGESMTELRRGISELGLKCAFLRPNPVGGRTLDNPAFEPLWSLLEELDQPLVLHEGTTQDLPQVGMDRYDNFLFRHMISHAFEQQMALLSLTCGGVLERHPNLRVVIVEAGCGWVPYWVERMDHHMKEWGHASMKLKLKPSEYFKRQCYVSADGEEEMIPEVISRMGDGNICFSTDYPHPDHPFQGVVAELAERADIAEQSKKKILADNIIRAFKL
jgi:predicted TIM-barrel fold metal-dependent hydrolase